MLNRLGQSSREARPLTPRERQQILRDYETLGPQTLGQLFNRTAESVKQHWKRLKREHCDAIAA